MRIETIARMTARLTTAAAVLGMGAGAALAAGIGQPEPWQVTMQGPVTEISRGMQSFHTWLVVIITAISLFVLGLLVAVCVKFNEKSHPTPSKTSHNTLLEVAWTVVPVLILVAISIPSFRLLRAELTDRPADIVIKATGLQWYWSYEYPADQGGFKFDSNMIPDAELKPGQPRLLAVDNEVVVPVNKTVKVQVTAGDVMHNFAVPSFGLKLDAIPGRLNQLYFTADREGVYYGQCSELCGNGHPYMPIAVRVVSQQQYEAWLAEAKTKFASIDGDRKVADAR
jgi:cytochrome c oxidase subunit 2